MHDEVVVAQFTRQAETFSRSAVANAAELLDHIVQLARPRPGDRWLEAASGPGIVSRRLAPAVAEVHGVDATPAMVELARTHAARENVTNVRFEVGDATALSAPDEHYDGVVARFALHHIPVPLRLFEQAARVMRAAGRIVFVDHLADSELSSYAWSQEVERLRDPSHWASLTLDRLRALGPSVGLTLEAERVLPMAIDFEDWLTRGSGGPGSAELVRRLVRERPGGTECLRLERRDGRETLFLRIWLSAWTKATRRR